MTSMEEGKEVVTAGGLGGVGGGTVRRSEEVVSHPSGQKSPTAPDIRQI